MRGRVKDCTHLPASPGPLDETAPYPLTPAGQKAVLAAHQEARDLAHRQHQARRARAAGKRFATIYPRWRRLQLVPELRLCGHWLEAAGFGLGRGFEVGVEEGRLVIQAV